MGCFGVLDDDFDDVFVVFCEYCYVIDVEGFMMYFVCVDVEDLDVMYE